MSELRSLLDQYQTESAAQLADLAEHFRNLLATPVREVPPAKFLTRFIPVTDASWDGSTPLPWIPLLHRNERRRAATLFFLDYGGNGFIPVITASAEAAASPLQPSVTDDRVIVIPLAPNAAQPLPFRVEGAGRLWVSAAPFGVAAVCRVGVLEEIDE